MTTKQTAARVHFVDVLRLIALAQMVNGHTLNAILRQDVRHGAGYEDYIWFRGLVSVAFMLVAGLAFQITTLARFEAHKRDPSAQRRRMLRALQIIAIGFLLRMPLSALLTLNGRALSAGLFELTHIDVLPCIGVSLLVLEGLVMIASRPLHVVLACAGLSLLCALAAPWGASLPAHGSIAFVTGWLGPQAGSTFPLLPFSGYVFAGVVLGALTLPAGARGAQPALRLMAAGLAVSALAYGAARAPWSLPRPHVAGVHTPAFFSQKLAAVTLAVALLAYLTRNVRALPEPLRILAGETLAIYVFHLFVLYDAPIQLYRRVGERLPLSAAMGVSACMLVASVAAGLGWHRLKHWQPARRFIPSPRATLLASCVIAGCALVLLGSRALARNGAPGVEVKAVALTVADLEAAERFFIDTLGFRREAAARELSGPDFDGLVGLHGTHARLLGLALGREHIELFSFARPGRPAPSDAHSNDLWFQHLALVTSDLDAVERRVAAAGASVISAGPQTLPLSNPDAGGIRAFYFRGPAAHPLELIWFPRGKGQTRWHENTAPVLGIDHTAIAVSDSERSRAFYVDLLGLRVTGHSFNFGPEQVALSGVPGARVRITGLRGSDGPGVEFLEYETPRDGRPTPGSTHADDLWHSEITLAVHGLDAVVARLRAAHVRFVSDRVHDTRSLGLGGARGVIVLDPDGHAVRLVE